MRGKVQIFVGLLALLFGLAACSETEEGTVAEMDISEDDLVERPEPGDMALIPAGEFTMGTDNDPHRLKLAEPAHTVDLPAYEMDVYEVTNGQFARFQLESDYEVEGNWRDYYTIGKEDFPVANITWEDAKAFCEWAGKRLPTEAEWEKAARGAEQLKYPWGDTFDWTKANTNEHGVRNTIEVGSLPSDKSPYGMYDMMGNVQEWVSTELEPYPDAEIVDRSVFGRNYIVVRGGSYAMKGDGMSLFSRTAALPKAQYGYGVRCARDVDGGEASEGEAAQ